MARPRNATVRRRTGGVAPAFRSRSEEKVAAFLAERGIPFDYEAERITYIRPAQQANYTPDFRLHNGIYVEVKGYWTPADRQKIALVKRQHPDLDLRILFDRPETPIYPGSSTTYAMFCKGIGVPWAKGPTIPDDWLVNAS